jgi:hypothetical protein
MIFSVFVTILLSLIVILVVLVLMILFIPFAYASRGSYYDEEGDLEARVDWYLACSLKYSLMSLQIHPLEISFFGSSPPAKGQPRREKG